MRAMVRYAFLTASFALVTRALGWWAVPIAGAAWAFLADGARRSPWDAGLGAIFGWALILVWADTAAPLAELTRRAAGVFGVRPVVLLAATLLYAGVLAWSAAMVIALSIPGEPPSEDDADDADDAAEAPEVRIAS